jgi:hypothetical protein
MKNKPNLWFTNGITLREPDDTHWKALWKPPLRDAVEAEAPTCHDELEPALRIGEHGNIL